MRRNACLPRTLSGNQTWFINTAPVYINAAPVYINTAPVYKRRTARRRACPLLFVEPKQMRNPWWGIAADGTASAIKYTWMAEPRRTKTQSTDGAANDEITLIACYLIGWQTILASPGTGYCRCSYWRQANLLFWRWWRNDIRFEMRWAQPWWRRGRSLPRKMFVASTEDGRWKWRKT